MMVRAGTSSGGVGCLTLAHHVVVIHVIFKVVFVLVVLGEVLTLHQVCKGTGGGAGRRLGCWPR